MNTTPFRFTTWHFLHIGFTDDCTFMVNKLKSLRDSGFATVWIDDHTDFVTYQDTNAEATHASREVRQNGLIGIIERDSKKRIG
jgi:hypothetical protein